MTLDEKVDSNISYLFSSKFNRVLAVRRLSMTCSTERIDLGIFGRMKEVIIKNINDKLIPKLKDLYLFDILPDLMAHHVSLRVTSIESSCSF